VASPSPDLPGPRTRRAPPPWTREQIRAARLAPLLERRGLALLEHAGGNFEVREHPGILVKDSYWRWPERALHGNAIDFCTQILRLSFHQAMRELSAS
jgi:hypothetical protein